MSWLSFYTPRNAVGGLYWIHPVCLSVCPSVRPSVCQLTFRVRPVASTVHDGFFPYLVQMIHSMRGCVACDDPWPLPISSRSFGLDLENRVHSVASTVLDGFFLYLAQMIIIIKGYVACHVFICDQAALWMVFSVRLSVCLSHLFDYVPIIVSSWNFQELSHWTRVRSMQKVKVRGQRSRSQRSRPNFSFPDCNSSLNSHDDEMIHIAWCCLEEVPYCFSRSSVKFQGHTALKSPNLTQIGRFRTVAPVWIHQWLWNAAQSLSSIEEVPYCFWRSSVKFQGHTALKNVEFDPDWAFPDCNSSLN